MGIRYQAERDNTGECDLDHTAGFRPWGSHRWAGGQPLHESGTLGRWKGEREKGFTDARMKDSRFWRGGFLDGGGGGYRR